MRPKAISRALSSDMRQLRLAERNLRLFRRELQASWSFATPKRMGFLFWYSGAEQANRYHAVKANAFALAPTIPERLLNEADPYRAYLLANVMPGDPGSAAKPAGVMLSTEGVVSSLFFRWATCSSEGWLRCGASATGVSLLMLTFGWVVAGGEGLLGYALGVSGFAIPSALYPAVRRRWAQLMPSILGWALAALPAKLLTCPFF